MSDSPQDGPDRPESFTDFLRGDITSRFLPGADASPGSGRLAATPSVVVTISAMICSPIIVSIYSAVRCPRRTETFKCKTTLTFCGGQGCP